MEDKFITYSSIALAGEESFVRLVRHGEDKSNWTAWLEAHPEMRPRFDEAKRIVAALKDIPQAQISESDRLEIWKNISSNIKTEVKGKSQSKLKGIWTWGMAAAASLAMLLWFGSEAGKIKTYADAGEHKEIALPEKSIVSLNAESRIIFKEKTFEKDRVLQLEGEAFFDVAPGSTFKVMTNEGTVTVVGTSFNVIARDGRFEVSCYTGKVRVERFEGNKTELTTGQRTIAEAGNAGLEQSVFNATNGKPEWTTGKFRYENRPLEEVIHELERQYDVDVILADGLGEINYTGLFESGDLAEALQLITWPLHLESSIKGKTITITR